MLYLRLELLVLLLQVPIVLLLLSGETVGGLVLLLLFLELADGIEELPGLLGRDGPAPPEFVLELGELCLELRLLLVPVPGELAPGLLLDPDPHVRGLNGVLEPADLPRPVGQHILLLAEQALEVLELEVLLVELVVELLDLGVVVGDEVGVHLQLLLVAGAALLVHLLQGLHLVLRQLQLQLRSRQQLLQLLQLVVLLAVLLGQVPYQLPQLGRFPLFPFDLEFLGQDLLTRHFPQNLYFILHHVLGLLELLEVVRSFVFNRLL